MFSGRGVFLTLNKEIFEMVQTIGHPCMLIEDMDGFLSPCPYAVRLIDDYDAYDGKLGIINNKKTDSIDHFNYSDSLLAWYVTSKTQKELEKELERIVDLFDIMQMPWFLHRRYDGYCGNCHRRIGENDKYCRRCGTKKGEGAFDPFYNEIQIVYGSPMSMTGLPQDIT